MRLRQKDGKPGLIGRILWGINVLIAVVLLVSYLSSYVDPAITTVFAFLGLAYPILLLLNLLFLLYWLIRGRKKLLLSLVVILIGYNPLMSHVQIMPGREAPEHEGIQILSYNVQNMAHSNAGVEKEDVRQAIYSFVGSRQASMSCLQEFSARGSDYDEILGELRSRTHYPYSYFANYNPHRTHRLDAMVILSQEPAIEVNTLSVPGETSQFGIYADFSIGGDTFRVYNLHLESIRLRHEDYQFVEDISSGQTKKSSLGEGSLSILRKLHNAFKTRSMQTRTVINNLEKCPYPCIICGDFNDTPLSYAYHKISHGLKDAYIEAGLGLGNTFSGNLPPIRIDFIIFSPVFQAYDFKVHSLDQSDHYPISVFLSKNGL